LELELIEPIENPASALAIEAAIIDVSLLESFFIEI